VPDGVPGLAGHPHAGPAALGPQQDRLHPQVHLGQPGQPVSEQGQRVDHGQGHALPGDAGHPLGQPALAHRLGAARQRELAAERSRGAHATGGRGRAVGVGHHPGVGLGVGQVEPLAARPALPLGAVRLGQVHQPPVVIHPVAGRGHHLPVDLHLLHRHHRAGQRQLGQAPAPARGAAQAPAAVGPAVAAGPHLGGALAGPLPAGQVEQHVGRHLQRVLQHHGVELVVVARAAHVGHRGPGVAGAGVGGGHAQSVRRAAARRWEPGCWLVLCCGGRPCSAP
jgi:hypothetical protein